MRMSCCSAFQPATTRTGKPGVLRISCVARATRIEMAQSAIIGRKWQSDVVYIELVDARRGLKRHDLLSLQVQVRKVALGPALTQKVVVCLLLRQEAVSKRNESQVERLIQMLSEHLSRRRDLTCRSEAATPHDLAKLPVQQVYDRRHRFRAKRLLLDSSRRTQRISGRPHRYYLAACAATCCHSEPGKVPDLAPASLQPLCHGRT